jgi:Flp pilus assembly protein CpaB
VKARTLIVGVGVLVAATAVSIIALRALTAPTKDVVDEVELATVVISTERIEANQRLDPLIEQGVFKRIEVPLEAVVEGAITDVIHMEGAITTAEILKNEQISSIRLTTDPAFGQ